MAGYRIAHAYRYGRGWCVTFLDDVEMMIESRDLVDFRGRQPHLPGESRKMRGRKMAVAILNLVQMLDQQIATTRRIPQQLYNLLVGSRINLAPLGRRTQREGGKSTTT